MTRASFASLLMHRPEVLLGLRKKLRQQQAKQRHAQERLAEAARERPLAHAGEQYPTTAAEHALFEAHQGRALRLPHCRGTHPLAVSPQR